MRPASFDPFLYKAADTDKANYMVAEVLAKLDPTLFITGVVIVIDMETATIQHLNQRSFPMVKKFMRYFTVRTCMITFSSNKNRKYIKTNFHPRFVKLTTE